MILWYKLCMHLLLNCMNYTGYVLIQSILPSSMILSDHLYSTLFAMYTICRLHCAINPKEWPDDLEISTKGVKTKVAAFCLLIASMVVSLPNSTSIHVITYVLCFRYCNTFYGMQLSGIGVQLPRRSETAIHVDEWHSWLIVHSIMKCSWCTVWNG